MTNNLTIIEENAIQSVPFEETIKDDVPDYLAREEVHEILSSVDKSKIKEFIFINFLWNTGTRITEAISVKKGNIDFNTKNIKVLWLKRRKLMTRTLPINDKFMYLLATYTGGMNKDELLFDFTRQRACQILNKYDKILNKHIHPHLFRHSFAVNYLKQTDDIVGLMKLLGHANIRNTMIYARIVNSDIREKLNKIEF